MHYIEKSNSKNRYTLSKLKNKKKLPYNGVCVKRFLVEVYGLRCCYCESLISSNSYFQVDHFYPQNLGYLYCDDVENFHLSCPRCNSNKSDKLNNLSPNYYYDTSNNCWKLSTPDHFSKHIQYQGPKIISPTCKYDIFINNLSLNGWTDSESNGWHLALIEDRSAYLQETQFLLQKCISFLKNNLIEDAETMILFVSKRFKRNAQYSTMIVNNYGLAMKKMLIILKKKNGSISAIVDNILK